MKVIMLSKNGPKVVGLNRRKAVRERCLNCAGWFHKEITDCTFTDCHLYPFRSGQGKQNAKARAKAIRFGLDKGNKMRKPGQKQSVNIASGA